MSGRKWDGWIEWMEYRANISFLSWVIIHYMLSILCRICLCRVQLFTLICCICSLLPPTRIWHAVHSLLCENTRKSPPPAVTAWDTRKWEVFVIKLQEIVPIMSLSIVGIRAAFLWCLTFHLREHLHVWVCNKCVKTHPRCNLVCYILHVSRDWMGQGLHGAKQTACWTVTLLHRL